MMKRFVLLLSVLLVSTGILFAADEAVSLKGKLTATNRIHPELSVNGKVYELLLPRHIVDELDDGEEISIEGIKSDEIPCDGRGRLFFSDTENKKSDRNFVKVNKITAKGKTLDIQKEFGDFNPGERRGMGRGEMMNGGNGNRTSDEKNSNKKWKR